MVVYSTQEDPPEIRKKLEALQSQNNLIEELQLRLNPAQSERDRLEKEIDEYRASVLSGPSYIRKCPKEVLMIVFEFYTLANPLVVRRLLLVCREWYQLAVSMPRLWNRIPISLPYVWDIRSPCKNISRRVEIFLQRSGPLLLELDLDLSSFETSRAKICRKIVDCFEGSIADLRTFRAWAYGLSTDDIEDFGVLPACDPQYVFDLVEQLMGKTGNVMRRWGSLRLVLPADGSLAAMVWEHFEYPTPHLSRIELLEAYEMTMLYGKDHYDVFPDLGALRHLELYGLDELDGLPFEVSVLETFVLEYVRDDISSLSSFTNLHTLKLVGSRYAVLVVDPVTRTTVSLPRLRNLCVQWFISGIQNVHFDIPKLECLDIFCRGTRLLGKENYARVQTERLSWRFEKPEPWEGDMGTSITSELQSILVSYPNTAYFTFPFIFKEVVIAILREPDVNSALSSALREVTFEGPLGDRETVVAQGLGYQTTR
ncbi:hypothetical protein M408DRAFT_19955 [Serendipita vermifera MAFF 305830]|uniref:F-box domain-containing protein n=1 Tax=Serendipita vermifera MAFF 305830 TaxID=933852 RepID=A0A0C3B6V2_SERVB|nr:hypothetical protein M408DRAFT_19955 [Serendipita vermifera MAFF 305830]